MSEYKAQTDQSKSPSRMLLFTEPPRALGDLIAFTGASSLLGAAPQGDNHPVFVIPGFMASDVSTYILRRFLKSLGYQTHGWDMGRNTGPNKRLRRNLWEKIQNIADRYGQKVSLIGQSLGGIYAREISREIPDIVRQVVTLGSPFGGSIGRGSAARPLFEYLTQRRHEEAVNSFSKNSAAKNSASKDSASKDSVSKNFSALLPVPGSAFYTKFDGIVDWRDCVQKMSSKNRTNPQMENIEVICSHCGMGVHPAVLYAIADRLAQPENDWKPFAQSDNISAISRVLVYPKAESLAA